MHGKKYTEQNKLHNTSQNSLLPWGNTKQNTKKKKKITENCDHNNYEKNGTGIEKLSKNTVMINPHCAQIRFPSCRAGKNRAEMKTDRQTRSIIHLNCETLCDD